MSKIGSGASPGAAQARDAHRELVTFSVAKQLFGIGVLQVQDVLGPQSITRVHLAPPEIAGSLNLRGRIVTAVDIRHRLGLPPAANADRNMSIVVEHEGHLYSIVVDQVGEVMSLPIASFEHNPSTLDPRWREISSGVFRLQDRLLVEVEIARLLIFSVRGKAA